MGLAQTNTAHCSIKHDSGNSQRLGSLFCYFVCKYLLYSFLFNFHLTTYNLLQAFVGGGRGINKSEKQVKSQSAKKCETID